MFYYNSYNIFRDSPQYLFPRLDKHNSFHLSSQAMLPKPVTILLLSTSLISLLS